MCNIGQYNSAPGQVLLTFCLKTILNYDLFTFLTQLTENGKDCAESTFTAKQKQRRD